MAYWSRVPPVPLGLRTNPNGINVQEYRGGTPLLSGFWVENVNLPKGSMEGLRARWILVEQVPQVGSWLMSCGDGE